MAGQRATAQRQSMIAAARAYCWACLALLAMLGAQGCVAPGTDDGKTAWRVMSKAQRSPVSYELRSGHILFRAQVAGHNVWAILDTGADGSAIDPALARDAGLVLRPDQTRVLTSHGTMSGSRTADVTVVIPAQLSRRYPDLPAIDLGAISKSVGCEVRFVLGRDAMQSYVLSVDPGERTFELVPHATFTPLTGAARISLQKKHPPLIEVEVGDEKTLVLVDTGASSHLSFRPEAWARLVPANVPTGSTLSTSVAGKSYLAKTAVLQQVGIGTLRIKSVVARELPPHSNLGLLGMGILGRFRFALDLDGGALWLGPQVDDGATSH